MKPPRSIFGSRYAATLAARLSAVTPSGFLSPHQTMGKAQFRVIGDAAVGSILFKGMLVEFAIDAADVEKVSQHRWHLASNSYIATSVKQADISGGAPESKKKELYLHTFLLNPGPEQVVHHISKNGLDNRRKNLRMSTATDSGVGAAATRKKRTIELPPMCGLELADIPKHVWYVQANGYHRDRFAIELKTEGLLWKSSSSKKFSLQEKLDQTKEKLKELYELYPHLDPKREEELIASLNSSFEALLSAPTPAPTS